MTNVVKYVKREDKSALCHIVENNFAMTIATKWKPGLKNFILLIYSYVSILENSTYRQRVLQIEMDITYTAVSKHLGSFDRSGFCHHMSLFKAAISQFATKWNTILTTNKVHIDTITICGVQLLFKIYV